VNSLGERVGEAMHRMADEVHPGTTMPEAIRHRTRRRQVRTATGMTVGLAALTAVVVVFGAVTLRHEPPKPTPVPAEAPTFAQVPAGWSKLPAPPEVRQDGTFVWAGDRLLNLGGTSLGSSSLTASAYSLGPIGEEWSRLPGAPLASAGARAVWTGGEALFFGVGQDRWRGEAFDPAASTWRILPDPPIERRDAFMLEWTGSEMIVWGGGSRTGPPDRTGAAYDPRANSWRRLPDAPLGLNQGGAVWAWPRMIVLGSLLDESNAASTKTAVGEEYDPRRNTWRLLPPSSLSPQANSIAAMGRTVLAWDYVAQSQTGLFPIGTAPAQWRDVVDMPLRPTECYPDSTVVQNDASAEVFAWFCGQAALWDQSRAVWMPIADAPSETFRTDAPSFAAEDVIGAGRIVLLPPVGDHDWTTWAYRPPSNAPTAAEVAPPTFESAAGWHTVSTSPDPAVLEPNSYLAAWAANVPFDPADLAAAGDGHVLTVAGRPDATLRSLGPGDVAITVWLTPGTSAPASPNVNFPESGLPPQLSSADVAQSWEGQVAPNVPEYGIGMTVDGRPLEVRVYFGTLQPSAETLAAAQGELDRLRLPSVS
jgi:hypothetical protein